MLAYLFFHRAAPGVDARAYEDGLRRFHEALAQAGVPGFAGSRTYRTGGRYCDWYLVESSASLDALNDAAVSGGRSVAHDDVARQATDAAGKLLKLVSGSYDANATNEVRFAKPRGMSYADHYARLKPWTERGDVSLWRRMMVLGPAPEFCLLARSDVQLPAEMEPEVSSREGV